MKKLIIIFLLISGVCYSQLETGKQLGWKWGLKKSAIYQYALDFDGSTEYLSCTPALRLTGEYSLVDNFSDGNYDGWTVSSGAYSVVDSVPLSGGTKSLKCTTAGIISIPCNQAYGSWEFDWYKGADGNTFNNIFIGDNRTGAFATNTGYDLFISNTEYIRLNIYNGNDGAYFITATNYFIINTWYHLKITRNTNGQFYVYIKGGTFGSDYVLVSVTGGSGTNPVTDNTYTSSNYFVLDLDASDMIANIVCQQGEGSLDLNSYERIYHSDNRNFTKTGGFAWTGNGTHSIDTTSTDKRTGTYSGKLISTGAGDSTTNFVNLPSANFDTLKTDVNGVYEKYTLEFWVKSKGASGLPRISVRIGNQLKQSDTISNIAFEKFVFNFQSNALVSNQDIKMWVNQADTVYVDDVSLTKGWDLVTIGFANPTNTSSNKVILGYNSADFTLRSASTSLDAYITDVVFNISPSKSSGFTAGAYSLASMVNNRIGGNYVNANGTSGSNNTSQIGKYLVTSFRVGVTGAGISFLTGKIGHIQIVKFTDISQSNVNSTTLTTAYNRGKLLQGEWTGGSPIEVAFYDWKGADATEMLRDKSGTGNNLTGTNIDLNDRIKVKGKFK